MCMSVWYIFTFQKIAILLQTCATAQKTRVRIEERVLMLLADITVTVNLDTPPATAKQVMRLKRRFEMMPIRLLPVVSRFYSK